MSKPHVQLLYLADCPNYEPTRELIEQMSCDLGIELDLELTEITDARQARRLRFLGSPTVRVGGRDIDPEADSRGHGGLGCRIYRGEHGTSGRPGPSLLRDALERSVR